MVKVYFKGTKAEAKTLVRRLHRMLLGLEADEFGIAQAFQTTLGFAALGDIKESFIIKSRGGTDAMGISWPPLSRAYLAYGRRIGRTERAELKKGAGLGRGHHHGPGGSKGLLSASQLHRWNQIFHAMVNKLSLSKPMSEAKQIAAKIAWSVLKREGAKTLLEVFGDRKVDILRDTGILLNSLTPGQLEGINYSKPTGEGGQQQIFELKPGRIIIGTNVKYAGAHQNGIPGKLPRRQFLPEDGGQVPQQWWDRWLGLGAKSLEQSAQVMFEAKS